MEPKVPNKMNTLSEADKSDFRVVRFLRGYPLMRITLKTSRNQLDGYRKTRSAVISTDFYGETKCAL